MTEQKKTTSTLLPADLIVSDHGRFHPELKIENGMKPTAWIKEHGLKAHVVEIEDAECSLNDWAPESKYKGAFPVAIFQTEEWDEESFTAIFAYKNTAENRKIKLKTLAENLNEQSAAAYVCLWLEIQIHDIENAARADAKKICVGELEITDLEQVKWFKLGMLTAASLVSDCPVSVDANK
jgi:hypothetical protein